MINLTKLVTLGLDAQELDSPSASVALLFILDILFLGVVIYAYKVHLPDVLCSLLSHMLAGWNGALAAVLNSKHSSVEVEKGDKKDVQ